MADPVFVDDVTPLNAVNMNKLQTRDEKASANGYASLGSDGKVPAGQLPTPAPAGAGPLLRRRLGGGHLPGRRRGGQGRDRLPLRRRADRGRPRPRPVGSGRPRPCRGSRDHPPRLACRRADGDPHRRGRNFMWQLKLHRRWGDEKWACIGGIPYKTDPPARSRSPPGRLQRDHREANRRLPSRRLVLRQCHLVLIICTVFGATTARCSASSEASVGRIPRTGRCFCPRHAVHGREGGRSTLWIDRAAGETLSVQVGLQGRVGQHVIISKEGALEFIPWAVA